MDTYKSWTPRVVEPGGNRDEVLIRVSSPADEEVVSDRSAAVHDLDGCVDRSPQVLVPRTRSIVHKLKSRSQMSEEPAGEHFGWAQGASGSRAGSRSPRRFIMTRRPPSSPPTPGEKYTSVPFGENANSAPPAL